MGGRNQQRQWMVRGRGAETYVKTDVSMKAVLQYRVSEGFRRRLADMCPSWLAIRVVEEVETEAFARDIAEADVLLHVLEPVTAAVIAAAPRLKLIQKIGVGVNTIDLAAATARGIAVANMPGINAQAVAEFTLGLMLAILRRVSFLDAQTKMGHGWTAAPETFDHVGEISGRTIGFMGFGQIARRVAPAIEALGGRVAYANRTIVEDGRYQHVRPEALLAESDVVSLHLPLTQETTRILDGHAFSRMKRGSVLINTARGGLVDEDALVEALRSGHLAGAALDVLASEPPRSAHPLLTLPNVIVTPHIAWLTPETLQRSLEVAIQNCRNLRGGQPLLNRVV
jgi:phosphoglycerate dehydrogenase-like enzyme